DTQEAQPEEHLRVVAQHGAQFAQRADHGLWDRTFLRVGLQALEQDAGRGRLGLPLTGAQRAFAQAQQTALHQFPRFAVALLGEADLREVREEVRVAVDLEPPTPQLGGAARVAAAREQDAQTLQTLGRRRIEVG